MIKASRKRVTDPEGTEAAGEFGTALISLSTEHLPPEARSHSNELASLLFRLAGEASSRIRTGGWGLRTQPSATPYTGT